MNISCDGLVLYTDGSFRRGQAGWGVHGYAYTNTPLADALKEKQLPTAEGYKEVDLAKTVTPIKVIDAYGPVTKNPTNNTGELQGAISALEMAFEYNTQHLLMLMDSEYVRKGIGYVSKWAKNGWVKADGAPVANQDYWKALHANVQRWEALERSVEFKWVKGHNGNRGNEAADHNALLGSGGITEAKVESSEPVTEKLKLPELNPMIMKARMIFQIDGEIPSNNGYYYLYHLGRLHKYGHKQEDSALDKIRKTDLILGRRNSEACFSVFKAKEPEPFLETLKTNHAQAHARDVIDIGVIRLDMAYKANVLEKLLTRGPSALITLKTPKALVTAQDELVSITLDPPRMAREAVAVFNDMHRRLDEALAGTLGKGVQVIDVTELFYGKTPSGKKDKEVTKLHKTITNTTHAIEVKATVAGKATVLKLVLGIDLPNRNALAKLADHEPKVTVLVVMDGPVSYSFSTVFETSLGAAIYQTPYANYVLKH